MSTRTCSMRTAIFCPDTRYTSYIYVHMLCVCRYTSIHINIYVYVVIYIYIYTWHAHTHARYQCMHVDAYFQHCDRSKRESSKLWQSIVLSDTETLPSLRHSDLPKKELRDLMHCKMINLLCIHRCNILQCKVPAFRQDSSMDFGTPGPHALQNDQPLMYSSL